MGGWGEYILDDIVGGGGNTPRRWANMGSIEDIVEGEAKNRLDAEKFGGQKKIGGKKYGLTCVDQMV